LLRESDRLWCVVTEERTRRVLGWMRYTAGEGLETPLDHLAHAVTQVGWTIEEIQPKHRSLVCRRDKRHVRLRLRSVRPTSSRPEWPLPPEAKDLASCLAEIEPEALEATLEAYAAAIRRHVPDITEDCDWLIEFEYRQRRPVEKAARIVRTLLAMSSPVEKMAELLSEPLQSGESDES
jgi:hypothetical protein